MDPIGLIDTTWIRNMGINKGKFPSKKIINISERFIAKVTIVKCKERIFHKHGKSSLDSLLHNNRGYSRLKKTFTT